MERLDLVIRHAQLATVRGIAFTDIGIVDGRVSCLGQVVPSGTAEIDAGGRFVTPGGVDGHCHMDQPAFDGMTTADDFESGTRSAACGGTTTVIPFALQVKGQSLREAVDNYHLKARDKATVDYAFHIIVSDPSHPALLSEISALMSEGYTSLKIYMTYESLALDDYNILRILECTKSEGGIVMVHAENDACIRWLTERLISTGQTSAINHERAHSTIGEREATHRAISLSELVACPILVAHVSGRDTVEQIRWAQARGIAVHGETCPQYLFLSRDDLKDGIRPSELCVCTPPPRDKSHHDDLWQGLIDGTLQVFSSDHSPYFFSQKLSEGPGTPFQKVPNGIPGIETRLPLIFSQGVIPGRITLERFVAITATNPARLYGLFPRKGDIAIGSDADLVIWNTDSEFTLTNDLLHHATDYTPYEGMHLNCWPAITILRGNVVYRDGQFLGSPGSGQFIKASRPALVTPGV